jgi:CheY-like chemotaxis protein
VYKIISKAKILVIDDFAGFRQTIKTMLAGLGAQHIDQAGNGNDAIKCCSELQYDIIFCDYNLGEGQDGQQILEELHHRKLLRHGTLFLMVTAETTRAQVMGAIEYRPDAYLTKPFTGEQLGQRLKRLQLKNEIMRPIYDALNAGNSVKAIALCDQITEQVPKVKYSCLRIKAEVLEQQQKYAEALALYQQVTAEQPVLWAMIGIGRIVFNQGQIKQALQQFETMRENFAEQVSVLDWVAKCQQALGELDEAETTLQQAVQISPKSVSRQAFLGQVASKLQHTEIAQKAFSKTIYEGNYSCKLKPEYYREYYDNSREMAQGMSGRELTRLVAETETMEKKMVRKYQGDPTALAANLSSAARLFSDLGKTDKSGQLLKKLGAALQHPECKIDADQLEYIESSLQQLPAEADHVKKTLTQISASVQSLQQKIKQQPQVEVEVEKNTLSEQAKQLNAQGLQFARNKQPFDALEMFRQAIAKAPDKTNYCLNAAQIIIEHRDLKQKPQLLDEAEGYLTQTVKLNADDVRWKRYQKLLDDLAQRKSAHA